MENEGEREGLRGLRGERYIQDKMKRDSRIKYVESGIE
jgi:hypothetical protein